MRIVVAGGTGFLGRALVQHLRDAHEVSILTRRPRGPADVVWSPDEPTGTWTSAVQSADAVINLAGESIAGRRWTAERKQAILRSRVAATSALAGAIARAPHPPLLISASATGIYGPHGDEPLTEDTPPGTDFLAEVCRQWEAQAQAVAHVTRVVLLRTGLVLEHDGGALPQLALPFRFFAGGPLGSGRQYVSWIHRDDWVEMVRWSLGTQAASGALNVTAPTPVTNAEFARTLGRVLHRPALVPTPGFALRLALGEMADAAILSGQRVLPAKAQSLGFAFRYEALEPALRSIYGRA
jgi:uncharacterized protein (TIGR01777 family)